MVVGSALNIPLADEQFDAVVCVDGFCQIDRPRVAMSEAARMLRRGGKFCFEIFTPADDTFGCGEQIGAGRLKVMPLADYCVDCQSKNEKEIGREGNSEEDLTDQPLPGAIRTEEEI